MKQKEMKKKYLGVLMMLIMVFTMLPGTPVTVSATGAPAATIGEQGYNTLQEAVDAVTEGQIIKLGSHDGAGVIVSNNCNFTIDLNGKTWDSADDSAIIKGGNGTIIITDTGSSGVITSKNNNIDEYGYGYGTIRVVSGSAIIMSGTVRHTSNRPTICNIGSGGVSVTGGKVENTSAGSAISNDGDGSVTLTGGRIESNNGIAIKNDGTGTISIPSGTVEIITNSCAMDKVPNLGSYTDVQILAKAYGASSASVISSETLFSNVSAYKYLKFNSAKITSQLYFSGDDSQDCTNTTKHISHIHADGRKCWAWDKDNNTLILDGVDIEVSGGDSALYFEGTSTKKLVLKGNNNITHKDGTFNSVKAVYAYALEISGPGAVTLHASDKTGIDARLISSGIYTSGKLKITSGTITAVGGAVSSTGKEEYRGSESYGLWGYGDVEITGGTVNATGGNVVFDNYGYSHGICHGAGGISLLGGTVTAQATMGNEPFSANPTLTNMRHKAGTGTWNNTTGTACTYEYAPFVAVNDITMTNAASVQTNTALTLAGAVTPSDATNQTIVWSVQNAGGTGARITGSTFRATTAGTATIRATVTKGASESSNYTKDFTITVSPGTPPFAAVNDITMTNAASVQTNTALTLAGAVTPSDATNQTIVWSVQNAGGTGATISGDIFSATTAGTATIRATVIDGSGAGNDYTKHFTITVNIPPTSGSGSGGFGGGASTPTKNEGKLEKDQKQEGNAPAANLKDSTEELKTKVLSAAEQEQIAAGKDAKVILKVQDISTSVSAEDKKRIEEKLAAEQLSSDNPALLYVDISLYKQVGDGQETKVTQTSGKIKISIEVPESMWSTEAGADRIYRVVRIHDGVTEILDGTYDPATHLFTFETDRFSTYVLTYQDGNTTSDQNSDGTSKQLTTIRDFNHLRLTAKADVTSQKLSYAKVAGADGYLIYGAQYGKKLKKLADVEGTVRSYTVKKLKKGTYYTYQVRAYKNIDGKKVIIAESSQIHSVTTSNTYGNPTKIIIKKSSITLTAGKTKKVTYQVVLPENKKMKAFAKPICFETTNPEIATISKNGTITAKAKGNCDVYVYAQNGVYKKIKLIVK